MSSNDQNMTPPDRYNKHKTNTLKSSYLFGRICLFKWWGEVRWGDVNPLYWFVLLSLTCSLLQLAGSLLALALMIIPPARPHTHARYLSSAESSQSPTSLLGQILLTVHKDIVPLQWTHRVLESIYWNTLRKKYQDKIWWESQCEKRLDVIEKRIIYLATYWELECNKAKTQPQWHSTPLWILWDGCEPVTV